MKTDRDFITFLKGLLKGKRLIFFIIVLSLAVFLLFFTSEGEEKEEADLNDTEARIEALCSTVDGVGECRVMVTFADDSESRVFSVAVVCEGGDSVRVRAALTELITSMYGIGAHRVSVMKLE